MTFEAGKFNAGQERIRIKQSSEFQSIEDVKNLVIRGGVSNLSTGLVRLGDVADVTMGYLKPASSKIVSMVSLQSLSRLALWTESTLYH